MVRKNHISNTQLETQRAQLEEVKARRIVANLFGTPQDNTAVVEEIISERLHSALWQIDNFQWICEIEAMSADHADLIDTQECAIR